MGRAIRFREYKSWGRYYTRFFRQQNAEHSKKRLLKTRITDERMYQKYGIHVHEPFTSIYDKSPIREIGTLKLTENVIVHQKEEAFWQKETDKVEPKVEAPFRRCLLFNGSKPLAEGINHALAIAKGVPREGLPTNLINKVENVKIDNLTDTLNRLIMQSQSWDPALEKLPKRRDPELWWRNYPRYFGIPQMRKNSILLDNMFRLTLSLTPKFSALKDLRYFKSGEINALTERSDDLLRISFSPYMTISSSKPLPNLQDKASVVSTIEETVPDIYPIEKKIDLVKENLLDDSTKEENVFPLMWSERQLTPHTLLLNKEVNLYYPWTTKEMVGSAIMSAFGAAVSIAKRKYGVRIIALYENLHKVGLCVRGNLSTGSINGGFISEEPIVTQLVQINGSVFDFIVFQLNTLDLNNDEGVKNIAWFDGGNKFFFTPNYWEDFKQVDDLNPDVFKKFLALMINSVA